MSESGQLIGRSGVLDPGIPGMDLFSEGAASGARIEVTGGDGLDGVGEVVVADHIS